MNRTDAAIIKSRRGLAWPGRTVAYGIGLVGKELMRLGFLTTMAWIGAMKFTAYEANAIEGLVANSPLMSWVYQVFSVTSFSALLGVLELSIVVLLAIGPWIPKASVIGSLLAVGMFSVTTSFLLSTPGAYEASAGGFPALSVVPGQFLIKDLVFLGVSLWLLSESLAAVAKAR